ncbi:MAG: sarcosine oxidase subunit gamma [Rhodobacteraceae bacterium]|nr:sarcosine oxidase subunit gamma [Paracoccaceae bacterium]
MPEGMGVSALPGARAGGLAVVREPGLQGMVSLKLDLTAGWAAPGVMAATGHAVPGQRQITRIGQGAVAWMAPDELLFFCPHAQADVLVAALSDALKDRHHLAVNMSDARVLFAIEGPGTREVLAKRMPVDVHPDSFAPGQMRRTRLAQVPAAVWMTGPQAARVVCARSVARYAFDTLALAAQQGGAVGVY